MISILIPTYNYIAYPLAESLAQQAEELGTPCEIIVADDASTNEESKQANRQISKLPYCTHSGTTITKSVYQSTIHLGFNAEYSILDGCFPAGFRVLPISLERGPFGVGANARAL